MYNYYSRRKRLLESCAEKKLDGYLTFDRQDIFYLTGFPAEGAFLLVSKESSTLFAPLLLEEQAKSLLKKESELWVCSSSKLLKSLAQTIGKNGIKRIGYDSAKVPVALFAELCRIRKISWQALPGFILHQRRIKDTEEIEAISRACKIAIQSYDTCRKNLQVGESEKNCAHRLEELFYKNGSPKPAFETIVAFGENAAEPHHVVTDKRLARNMAVLVDCGSTIGGYHSDLTRTFFFGKMTPRFQKIYRIVEKAQQEGIAVVRDGISAGKIDFICREVIRKEGYGDYFVHGTGHGVGLEIHEPPRLGIRSKEILKTGMVVTVEPGIYLPGEFGVRIEDTMLVQQNGCKILTR